MSSREVLAAAGGDEVVDVLLLLRREPDRRGPSSTARARQHRAGKKASAGVATERSSVKSNGW